MSKKTTNVKGEGIVNTSVHEAQCSIDLTTDVERLEEALTAEKLRKNRSTVIKLLNAKIKSLKQLAEATGDKNRSMESLVSCDAGLAESRINIETNVTWLSDALKLEKKGQKRLGVINQLEKRIKFLGDAKKTSKKTAKKKVAKKATKKVAKKSAKKPTTQSEGATVMLIDDISVTYNPRKKFMEKGMTELTTSVKAVGILQRLIVRYDDGQVVIVAGERRYRAAKRAGLTEVPVEVKDIDEKQAREIALVENLQREDLDLMEEAEGFHDLLDCGWTVAEMANRFSFSDKYIYSRLEARKFDSKVKAALAEKEVTLHVASALTRIESDDRRAAALDQVIHPTYAEGPLNQEKALQLLKKDYIDPQKEEKDWDAKEERLLAEYPGCEFVKYADKSDYEGYGHGYVCVDAKIDWWELKVELADKVNSGECEAPIWQKLVEKHGAFKKIVFGSGDEAKVIVEKKLLVTADAEWAGDDYLLKRAAAELSDEEKQDKERLRVQAEQKAAAYDSEKRKWFQGLVKRIKTQGVSAELVMAWYDAEVGNDDFLDEVEMLLGVEFKELNEGEGSWVEANIAQCREMVSMLVDEDPVSAFVALTAARSMVWEGHAGCVGDFQPLFRTLDSGEDEWALLRASVDEKYEAEAKAEREKAKAEREAAALESGKEEE